MQSIAEQVRPNIFSSFKLRPLNVMPWVVAFLVLTPLGVIFSAFFQDAADVWLHIRETILLEITINTIWLVMGVAIGTYLLGTSLAWLVTFCEFPGRSYFDWILMIPMAVPTYVLGFVWIGLLDYSGTIPSFLRDALGMSTNWLPPIRSRGGVMFVMTMALYPYVYLLARNAFLTQGRSVVDAATSLGFGRWKIFHSISVPMARPWIIGGLMLVIMETLADFGTVAIFNYDTYTTAIYKAWFGMFSMTAAAQLSSLLVLLVFVVMFIEYLLRGRRAYTSELSDPCTRTRFKLNGNKMIIAMLYPSLVLALAFMIPVTQLLFWGFAKISQELDWRYFKLVLNTVMLAALASALICAIAILLSYSARHVKNKFTKWMVQLSTLGYALPGTVLAVGIFSSLIWMDKRINHFVREFLGVEIGMILTGGILAMLLAYMVRFLRVAHSPIDSAMQRITLHIEEAARGMGYRGLELLKRVQIPMIKGGVLTALILVFVDVMKEMPITLMTRPFGWDTLSVRIFSMTSEGEWQRAALPALFLVVAGLIPVIYLARRKESNV